MFVINLNKKNIIKRKIKEKTYNLFLLIKNRITLNYFNIY